MHQSDSSKRLQESVKFNESVTDTMHRGYYSERLYANSSGPVASRKMNQNSNIECVRAGDSRITQDYVARRDAH